MTRHPRTPRPDRGPLWATIEFWQLCLRAEGAVKNTVDAYSKGVGLFADWLARHRPDVTDWVRVGRDELRAFFVWLQAAGDPCPHWLTPGDGTPGACEAYGRSSVNSFGRSLQRFFDWWSIEEDRPNPMLGYKIPAAPKDEEIMIPLISDDELRALIKHAETDRSFVGRRDAAILRLFACTGMRLAELASLDVEGDPGEPGLIDLEAREVTVRGKGRKVRRVKFDSKTSVALGRYLAMRKTRRAVTEAGVRALWIGAKKMTRLTTNGIYQALQRRASALGIKLHPHMLRHKFADRWKRNGGSEGDLMELCGWKSRRMPRRYGLIASRERALSAYDKVAVMDGI